MQKSPSLICKGVYMPEISVVIPVYNVEKYIERCVRSLFGQSLDSIEYIFIDDCSPDNSIAIMQQVLKEFPNRREQIKVIHHERNLGVGAARNHGVAACTGDYIIHCDSDDWVDSDFYETMYKKAVETGADVVWAPFVVESADNSIAVLPKTADSIKSYIRKNSGGHFNSLWNKLYRKEIALLQNLIVPDEICFGEDFLRNIQMLNVCRSIAFVSGTYYHYWQNPTSMTHNRSEKYFLNLNAILNILQNKYPDKYLAVRRRLKSDMITESLANMNKCSRLLDCFNEIWDSTSFSEKLKIIFFSNTPVRGKIAIAVGCISKSLMLFCIRQVLKRKQ
ncbi:MAG: glycosyltransferase family 2 protein [Lentisphaerae bacterium]|nr:glycosyltransferase family 2 protein [Lentisphaerota bacterium]